MSDHNPQVKKRLYTRLMDMYRHNDVYIPGFNLLTRTILKTKAESHFAKTSKSALSDAAEIDDWFHTKRLFFGYGVYRSGTTFLADFLNRHVDDAVVQHEANVNDYWFYAKAIHSHSDAVSYISDYRKAEIFYRTKAFDFSVYGEINPFLRRHCLALKEIFPAAKHLQIVRNPQNVIRSLMSRELLGKKDPMAAKIFPPKSDEYAERWEKLSRFEKLCWMWAADNQFIRENVSNTIKFELLRADFDYFKENVLDFLELEMAADVWQKEIGKVYNSTPRYTFEAYKNWTAEQKKQFEEICAQEMSNYGY